VGKTADDIDLQTQSDECLEFLNQYKYYKSFNNIINLTTVLQIRHTHFKQSVLYFIPLKTDIFNINSSKWMKKVNDMQWKLNSKSSETPDDEPLGSKHVV
jgi:hypothetical protein